MNRPEFTYVDAIRIQREHLDQWKPVLKPAVFKEVERRARRYNDPLDVCRGDNITEIIIRITAEIRDGRSNLAID